MKKVYDIVIVGCGMAGALAGLTALKADLRVCIIEQKKREFIGKKICGELMPQHIVRWLKTEFGILIDYYPLKGLEISTPSEDTSSLSPSCRLRIEEPLCTIDRWRFGQLMVDELLKRGAEVHRGRVKTLVMKDGVKGVKTGSRTVLGAVTVDCSGVSSVFRQKGALLDLSYDVPTFGMAYKEEVVLEEPLHLDHAVIQLHRKVVPSGYLWLFPKSECSLNVGVGGLVSDRALLKTVLRTTIEDCVPKIRERSHAGFGALPLGKPLPSMVGPGLLVCGDAACQLNPLTGEGIAPALRAGYLAGKTAVRAVRNNDVSVEGMWQYNCDFAREYGRVHAPLLVLRDFLLTLSDEELTFLLEQVVTSEDVAQLEKDLPSPPWKGKIMILLKNWTRLPLLYRSYAAIKRMSEVKRLYDCYPEDPEEFPSWKQNLWSFPEYKER